MSADLVNKLRRSARRTAQLANQLRALSRIDAHSDHTRAMQRVDLKQLCKVVLESHLNAATGKDIDLGLDCAYAHTTGHEWRLRELLGNLVDNAIKYTPPGGRVTLRCGVTRLGAHGLVHAFLELKDNGPGMPMDPRALVLERFYRVTGTMLDGTGLGLRVARYWPT